LYYEAFPKLQVLGDKQSLSGFPGFGTVPETNTEPQVRILGIALILR
jgi:hypothetical protein